MPMSTAHRTLLTTLIFSLGGTALAQEVKDLTITLPNSPSGLFISKANCADLVGSDFVVRGTLDVEPEDEGSYTLRLMYTTSKQACASTTFEATECVPAASETCSCLKEVKDTQEVSFTGKMETFITDACTSDGFEGYFHLQYVFEGDEIETGFDVEVPAVVTFDFVAPPTPSEQPTAVPVEGGALVSFPVITNPDVHSYEVCYRLLSATAPIAAVGSDLEVLRQGYTCRSANAAETKRLSDMENGVAYSVVYATYDKAGNRSANGPETTVTPVPSYDFAEWYNQSNGPATGGCTQARGTQGGNSDLFFALLGGLLVLRTRRRS